MDSYSPNKGHWIPILEVASTFIMKKSMQNSIFLILSICLELFKKQCTIENMFDNKKNIFYLLLLRIKKHDVLKEYFF